MNDYGRLRKHGELFGSSCLDGVSLDDLVRITLSSEPSFNFALAHSVLRPWVGGMAYQRLSTVATMESMRDVSGVTIKLLKDPLMSTHFGTQNPYC